MLSVGGYVLPFSAGALRVDAEKIPEFTVTLPVVDGLVVSLDARMSVSEETRGALIAMGWVPPGDGHDPADT